MRWQQRVNYAARTDVGMRRQNNEDSHIERLASSADDFAAHGHLFVVADGMGGHAVGELASKLAVETVSHLAFLKNGSRAAVLREAITEANATINARGTHNRDFERMGTTCTALSLSPEGAILGHVGDSRAYRVRRDRIDQLTFDHSVEWEVRRRHGGKVDAELLRQHRNVITRSLGPEATMEVDIEGPHPVFPGDRFLLCSDGLTGLVDDDEIGLIVRVMPPKESVRLLVDLANLRGGNDNCTVSVVDVGELPHGAPPPPDVTPAAPVWTAPWQYVMALALAALFVAAGLVVWATSSFPAGATLLAIGGLGAIPTFIALMRDRKQVMATIDARNDDSRTMQARAHATAVARPLVEMVGELQSAAEELQSAAREDGWPVAWDQHDRASRAARAAAEEKRFVVALREQAQAIHLLMRGLQSLRTGVS